MSYLGSPRSRRSSRLVGYGGALGALPSGVSAPITGDPVKALIQQVNRFAPPAPPAYAIIAAPFPLATGAVTLDVATAAMLILQRSALDPTMSGIGSVAVVAGIAIGMLDPVGYVTSNIAAVISTIQLYGDSVGLPSAGGDLMSMITSPMGLAVMAIAAAYLIMRKK